MSLRPNLEIDVLRTFVIGVDLGSFAQAADRLGRSPAGVSAQLRKLESQLEQPLFRKAGRELALTDAGELLLGYARRLLELNDEAVARVRSSTIEGWVRVGLPHCMFRAAATSALDKVGQPWHMSFTTPSLAGLWAAVESGLGLAVRTPIGVPRHLAMLGKAEKLPALPTVSLVFIGQPDAQTPAVQLLQDILRETVVAVVDEALAQRTANMAKR